jgi:hypothetical protein
MTSVKVGRSGADAPSGHEASPSAAISVASSRSRVPNAEDIDDAIEAWHEGAGSGLHLHEYLGWTWDEYVDWVRDADVIPQRPLASGTEAQRAAAREYGCRSRRPGAEGGRPTFTP